MLVTYPLQRVVVVFFEQFIRFSFSVYHEMTERNTKPNITLHKIKNMSNETKSLTLASTGYVAHSYKSDRIDLFDNTVAATTPLSHQWRPQKMFTGVARWGH